MIKDIKSDDLVDVGGEKLKVLDVSSNRLRLSAPSFPVAMNQRFTALGLEWKAAHIDDSTLVLKCVDKGAARAAKEARSKEIAAQRKQNAELVAKRTAARSTKPFVKKDDAK